MALLGVSVTSIRHRQTKVKLLDLFPLKESTLSMNNDLLATLNEQRKTNKTKKMEDQRRKGKREMKLIQQVDLKQNHNKK